MNSEVARCFRIKIDSLGKSAQIILMRNIMAVFQIVLQGTLRSHWKRVTLILNIISRKISPFLLNWLIGLSWQKKTKRLSKSALHEFDECFQLTWTITILTNLRPNASVTVFRRKRSINTRSYPVLTVIQKMTMRQFGPNTRFGPETESHRGQIRPTILITSKLG